MGCLNCLSWTQSIPNCVNGCLVSANINPAYPFWMIIGGIALALVFASLAYTFRSHIKRAFSLKLLALASILTTLFTIALVFNGHWLLKNLPIIIPLFAATSYGISYFFSFYFVKLGLKPTQINNKELLEYVEKTSKELKVKKPILLRFKSKEPKAFMVGGFKKAIFFSENLISKLNTKELQQVALHELYHIKSRFLILKNVINSLHNLCFRVIPSPIEEFNELEEEHIDKMMIKEKGIDLTEIRKKLSK